MLWVVPSLPLAPYGSVVVPAGKSFKLFVVRVSLRSQALWLTVCVFGYAFGVIDGRISECTSSHHLRTLSCTCRSNSVSSCERRTI